MNLFENQLIEACMTDTNPMDVFFTLQVEQDGGKNLVSLPLLVYASDADEAMHHSRSMVECIAALGTSHNGETLLDARDELAMLQHDIYMITAADVDFLAPFLARRSDAVKTEVEKHSFASLSVAIDSENFTDEQIKYLQVCMATHRTLYMINAELMG
jgi:hypothetical protein